MTKLCLIIIDGFGVAPPGPGNARTLAKMPTIQGLEKNCPNVIMVAAENAVGLPEGQMGASEPGHMTMGAGRIVWQPYEEINRSIRSGDFYKNPVLVGACERAKKKKVPLHLFGLYSTGGCHSHADHFHAMLRLAKQQGVERVYLHLFGDGRDKPEQYFCVDFDLLKAEISSTALGTLASLVGRYYGNDRDRRYTERTKVSYDLLTQGTGEVCDDFCAGAKAWYLKAPEKEKTDYYIHPLKTLAFQPIRADDVCVGINFRSDRMVQITRALEDPDFSEFPRPVRVKDVVCMGQYSDHLPIAFPATKVERTLGELVADQGWKQLRMAETDKFQHVTFFFNAQKQEPFPGEERVIVESPNVPNMADAPDMSADKIATELMARVKTEEYEFIVVNFANPDVVGHGGKLEPTIKACEAVDRNLTRLLPVLEEHGYDWILTSDHGNAEEMYFPGTTDINPSHTSNPVQTFVHSPAIKSSKDLKDLMGLKDIAPLCLKILGLPVPKEMK